VAKNLGVDRLDIPVLEEALFQPSREKVSFLDGLVNALDRLEAGGMEASLVLPAQNVLGLRWVIPELARPLTHPEGKAVFVAGRVRNLKPYYWWTDPWIIQKRMKAFSEALSAVGGHPVLKSLLIMDHALEWPRPDREAAFVVARTQVAEVREQGRGQSSAGIGLGWEDLLEPLVAREVSEEVGWIRVGGIEAPPKGIEAPDTLPEEVLLAAFMGSVASWLFEKATEVEVGWTMSKEIIDEESLAEACSRFAKQGLAGMTFLNLVEPEPFVRSMPPWPLRSDLDKVGLLNHHLDPKPWAEQCLKEMKLPGPVESASSFIDVGREEYEENPEMHLIRLWERFRRK